MALVLLLGACWLEGWILASTNPAETEELTNTIGHIIDLASIAIDSLNRPIVEYPPCPIMGDSQCPTESRMTSVYLLPLEFL